MPHTLDSSMVSTPLHDPSGEGRSPRPTSHFFSVDVEEHFQVSVFEGVAPRERWGSYPSRVEQNTDRLLALLSAAGARGTFFTLGWVAERHPGLIRRIVEQGHEVAAHGWWHRRVTTQTETEFREDVRSTKALLEDQTGTPIRGFRAPSFSIIPGGEWALDVLLEEGYTYDSSLFPVHRTGYGYPSGGTGPYQIHRPSGVLWELPPATTTMAGLRIPAAGGGYLRQFPLRVIQRAFRERSARGEPGMFYIHPWEIDPDQPRMPVGWVSRVRHYRGLGKTYSRLERLVDEFSFTSVAAWLESL